MEPTLKNKTIIIENSPVSRLQIGLLQTVFLRGRKRRKKKESTLTFWTARHQTIAGNEMSAEQNQRAKMKRAALEGVIREGYVIGSVIAQYRSEMH